MNGGCLCFRTLHSVHFLVLSCSHFGYRRERGKEIETTDTFHTTEKSTRSKVYIRVDRNLLLAGIVNLGLLVFKFLYSNKLLEFLIFQKGTN